MTQKFLTLLRLGGILKSPRKIYSIEVLSRPKPLRRGREVQRILLVLSVDPLLCIAGVGDQLFRFEPQFDLVFSRLWAITSVDNVPKSWKRRSSGLTKNW